jgi:hypothetical protein
VCHRLRLISLIKDKYSKRKRRRQKKESMEVKAKRAISVAFLVMLIALALPASPCGATTTSLLKKNGSNNHCNGRADDYVDLGFMMGSGMSRMLAEDPKYLFKLALIASKPAVLCGRPGSPYSSCQTGTKNHIKVPPNCSPYDRSYPCKILY